MFVFELMRCTILKLLHIGSLVCCNTSLLDSCHNMNFRILKMGKRRLTFLLFVLGKQDVITYFNQYKQTNHDMCLEKYTFNQ